MPYQGAYDFVKGRSNVKIEIDTSTGGATATYVELCGLTDISVDPGLKTDTFTALCDGADSTTVVVGRDIKISGTAKYSETNTQLKTLMSSSFAVGASNERKMRVTLYTHDAVLSGTWAFIAGEMSVSTDAVISIPFELKTVGKQDITKPTP